MSKALLDCHIAGQKVKTNEVMKIILSRKGFDTQYGGQPSPILPDGTLLSLPIPAKEEKLKFSELTYSGKSYLDIIHELKSNSKITDKYTCHLDPDLRKDVTTRNYNWRPLFGQTSSSQGHLLKNGVSKGDLFLFFGTFRETEYVNGEIHYIKGAEDLHLIFGYLQIGNIYSGFNSFNSGIKYHPHAQERFANDKNDCIYEASERFSLDETLKGAGCLNFHEGLILTKKGFSKSKWNLPSFFKEVNISYHSKNSFTSEYFQSAAKGQEFIIDENENVADWARKLIINGQ